MRPIITGFSRLGNGLAYLLIACNACPSAASAASCNASLKRRVRVYRSLQIFDRGLELDCEHGLGYQLAGHRTDDVDSQYLVVLLVRNDFDQARRLLEGLGTPVCCE